MMPKFGECCSELKSAMSGDFEKTFSETDGVLYVSVGYVNTEGGPGWFDGAVIFCPFCGTKIQDRSGITRSRDN